MEITFDLAKDAANQMKHGVSLSEASELFNDDDHLIIPSIREIDGEERFKIIGLRRDRLHTAVFVWRGDAVRFISFRKANKNEQAAYHSG